MTEVRESHDLKMLFKCFYTVQTLIIFYQTCEVEGMWEGEMVLMSW